FLFTHAPHTHSYTLSLHDALPISAECAVKERAMNVDESCAISPQSPAELAIGNGRAELSRAERCGQIIASTGHAKASRLAPGRTDRKSTRLNSSHLVISYAVFCLK